MNRKGVATMVMLCLVLAAAIIVGGIFYYARPAIAPVAPANRNEPANQSTTAANTLPLSASTSSPIPAVPSAQSSGLDPRSGSVGTVVTIHGNGFGPANAVEMNGLVGPSMRNLSSADGKTLAFTVPGTLGPNCKPNEACPQFLLEVSPNAYVVTVITSGTTQKIGTFTVTAK